MDENGYCRIVGRIKDMIIRGGENIYPREIEDVLLSHPAILNCAVVGAPDSVYGESVCACIILKPKETLGEEDVQFFVQERLAKFKVPKHVVFLEQFPMTVTGKIQKYRLQDDIKTIIAV